MLMRSTFSRLAKEKGHRVRVMGVLSAVEHIFNETAMHARAQASNRPANKKRSSHVPRARAKVRVKRTRENPKDNPRDNSKEPKVPKAHTKVKRRKLVSQVWITRNQRQARKVRNLHKHIPLTLLGTRVGMVTNGTMAGVLMNGMMTGVRLDGTKVVNKTYDSSASTFSLGGLDVGATSSPKRFEWVNMNLDTGASVNTFPIEFWSRGSRRWNILSDCQW